jgi:hypothetical protein
MKIAAIVIENWLLVGFFFIFVSVFMATKISKVYRSRREVFRAAKRENGVPMSMQPSKTVSPNQYEEWKKYELDKRNLRLYIFNLVIDLKLKTIYIREDKAAHYNEGGKGDQTPHFNAGDDFRNLKQHFYYQNKQGKKWKSNTVKVILGIIGLLILYGITIH